MKEVIAEQLVQQTLKQYKISSFCYSLSSGQEDKANGKREKQRNGPFKISKLKKKNSLLLLRKSDKMIFLVASHAHLVH